MDKIDPICGYIGGKWRWAPQITPVIMAAPNSPDTYYEIFGGMAGVLIQKPKHRIETYNDIDDNIFTLMKVMQDEELFKDFHRIAQFDLHCFKMFDYLLHLDANVMNDVYKAYRFYYLLKHSYGSQGRTWSRKVRKPGSVYEYPVIKAFHERIKYCNIENLDFRVFIEKYDRADAVAYLDPPYMISTEKHHYLNNFSENDHKELADLLRNAEMRWVLSYDDHPTIRELYEGFTFGETSIPYGTIDTRMTNGKREHRTELLITNYNYARQGQLTGFF